MKRGAMSTTNTAVMKLAIELITLPVSDVERALRSSTSIRVNFTLDVEVIFAERHVPRRAAHSAGLPR